MNHFSNPAAFSAASTPFRRRGTLRLLQGIGLAAMLAACGGGGTTSDYGASATKTTSNTGVVQSGIRALPASFTSRRAVNYSPFRTNNRDTETLTDANINQDLDLMVAAGFGLIRLFDSSDNVAGRVLRLIKSRNLDLKVMLGAYVNSFQYVTDATTVAKIKDANAQELTRAADLANQYSDIVVTVSVGNETLVSYSIVPIASSVMASYIKTVRTQIAQPVTTDEQWPFFAAIGTGANDLPTEVLAQIDFLAMHQYSIEDTKYCGAPVNGVFPKNADGTENVACWDWRQASVAPEKRAAAMMDAAIAKLTKNYFQVRNYMDSKGYANLPMVIGETGWKPRDTSGAGSYKFTGHPVNQKMFYDRLLAWGDANKNGSGPKNIFYFEAFDEPWKKSDDGWGLFNVKREARYVIQGKNKASSTWVYEAGTYTDTDALYYKSIVARDAISTNRYTLYADTAVTGETIATQSTKDLGWDAFDGNTVTRNEADTSTFAPGDGPKSLSLAPNPADYGWGILYYSKSNTTENMSAFATAGSLNFSINTNYTGKLEIGIQTDTDDRSGAEAYVIIQDGKYGYKRGQWSNVSIPLSAFKTVNAKVDFRYVTSRIVIADRFQYTGNTKQTALINIDNIYYAK